MKKYTLEEAMKKFTSKNIMVLCVARSSHCKKCIHSMLHLACDCEEHRVCNGIFSKPPCIPRGIFVEFVKKKARRK